MAVIDGGSTMVGSSAALAAGTVVFHFEESVSGGSLLSGAGGIIYIGSGYFFGLSSLEWDYTQEGGSTFLGTSVVTCGGYVIKNGGSVMQGSSSMVRSTLYPVWGTSFATLNPLVVTPLRVITMGPKVFRWQQLLQRGDLSVFLGDGDGSVTPFQIFYNLYFVRLDGSRKLVGPQRRTPVFGEFGEYYAVGRAGEGGQPGSWVIEWTYQRSTVHSVEKVTMPFTVLDAVLAQDPYDATDRKVKFGWN